MGAMAVTDRRGAWPYAGRPKSAGWLTSIATLAVLAAISPALAQNVTATGDIDPAPVNAPIWDVFAAIIGNSGTGVLNIEDGGEVSGQHGYLGLYSGSSGTATVTGAGSSWDNTAKLYVGEEGTGVLTIEDGGVVRVDGGAGQIDVARQAWSSGTINIGAAAGHGAVAAGTLNVETLQFGSGTGTLVFNHAGMPDGSDLSFDAEISGLGAIDHLAGTTVLTGDSSGFSGTTTISGGSLMLGSGATLGGVVNVGAGGTLGGTGMLGVTTIAAGGIHAPGHSIGTQTIDGDYTNHGTLVIEANPTSSDILVVNGAVDIAGADLSLLLTPTSATSWDIANSPFTYTIIANDDADAVTGQFASTSNVNQLLFLDASLDYAGGDGNDVALLLTRNTANFSGVAGTANQSGAAQAIESLGSGPLYDAIVTQTDDDIVRASFDALSGEIGAAARGTLTAPLQKMADAVNDRLLGASGGLGSAPVLAYGPGGPGLAAADTPLSVAWGSAFGNWGQSEDAGNAAGLSTRGGGLTGGIDGALGDWRLGLMAGYAGAAFAADDRASTGSSDSYSLGVYGGREWGALAFRSSLTASAHSLATSRDVAIPGFTDRLSADYNARSLQAFAELGYRFDVSGATSIEPFANLNQVLLDTDGYSESGGAAALTSAADTSASTFTTIGLRASHKIAMGTVLTTIRAMVGWRHGFGDLAPTSTMAFSGSTPFAVTGAQTPTNTALLSTGLDLNLSDDLTIGLGYAGRFADGTSDNTASATVAGTF